MRFIFRKIQAALREGRAAYTYVNPKLLPVIEMIKTDQTKSFHLSDEFVTQTLDMFIGDYKNPTDEPFVTLSDVEHKKMLNRMGRCAHLLKLGYPSIALEHDHPRFKDKVMVCTQHCDHISLLLFTYLDKFEGHTIDKVAVPITHVAFYPEKLATANTMFDVVEITKLGYTPITTVEKYRVNHPSFKESEDTILLEEQGLISPTIAILLALVSPRVTVSEEATHTSFNRVGKHKVMVKHRITKIDLHPKIKENMALIHGHKDVTKHWVIGHWKVRATGVFWWDHYKRGVGELVEREAYSV